MHIKTSMKIVYSTICCLFLFSGLSKGQTYSFKNYGAENNIPSGFVYTINQADDGFLWVGTSNGITRFDGFDFFPVQYPDSSVNRYPTSSIRDKNGSIWYGCSDGTVFYEKENTLINVPLNNTRSISDIIEGPDGRIYVIPQGKAVFAVNPVNPLEISSYYFSSDPVMSSAVFANSGLLYIGTQENLLKCRLVKDSVIVEAAIGGFDYSGITVIHATHDSTLFVIGTEDNGLFHLDLTNKASPLSRIQGHPELETLSIQSMIDDDNGNLWVSTKGSGIYQLNLSENHRSVISMRHYDTTTGLTADYVKTVMQDIEGNYWIGFYGEGISILSSYAFGYYTPGKNSNENNIIFTGSYQKNYLLGTPTGYHIFDIESGKSKSFTSLTSQVGNIEINTYYLDKSETLWIGTAGKGLYYKPVTGGVRLFSRSEDTGSDDIKDIEIDGQNIWLATTYGVIVLDRTSGAEKKRFDINNGLPHNSISNIFLAKDGTAYIATESDKLISINRSFEITIGKKVMSGGTMNKELAFSEGRNGAIWVATKGNGIFECFSDSISAVNKSNDLMSNYCYSILVDSENNIWVGHEKGFSRFNAANGLMRIFGTEYAKGGVCNPGALYESADKKIFIGTTEGLVIYDFRKDSRKSIPPFNSINSITIDGYVYPYQKSFSLPYKKRYDIKVSYSGISFRSPDKVYFSTYLENWNDDYTTMTTQREIIYPLSSGKYKFNLISVNEDGLSQEMPVSFDIIIKAPLWLRWWFILLSIATLAGIVMLIIRERDKSQRKIQEYLESELEARTSVVMKQKGEIELQNIEITDSINYAKRIQTSILPDITKLKEAFRDAFILFHPRDIVSGDFYWFDKLEDDKFIIVCADSTGHGVPGAFMSMIGSTLLQDIVTRQRISKPSVILNMLDKQIFSTLNQNVELGVSNDGMDMVVCEFNVKTRHLRFASAMRPIIIVLDGEPYYIKGNRLSVGGESAIEKFFDDQEYYLNEGDTVYLFSDGFPDQFGGIDGKKLKIARLKKLIEQVSKQPMNEQREIISDFFFEWKGTFEQVDDILMMGIKV